MAPTPEPLRAPASYGIGEGEGAPGELLAWETVEGWLAAAHNYWLCTTRADGRPHAKPIWGLWLAGAFYFSTDPQSMSGRNLRRSAEAIVHTESGDQVAIVEGRVGPLTERELLGRFSDAYEEKYAHRPDPENPQTPALVLRPALALAWSEKEFPADATRWVF